MVRGSKAAKPASAGLLLGYAPRLQGRRAE